MSYKHKWSTYDEPLYRYCMQSCKPTRQGLRKFLSVPVQGERQCAGPLVLTGLPGIHRRTHPAPSHGEAACLLQKKWFLVPPFPLMEAASVQVVAMMICRHLEWKHIEYHTCRQAGRQASNITALVSFNQIRTALLKSFVISTTGSRLWKERKT